MDSKVKSLLHHTEVRWLSRERMLTRFVELKEEIKLFLSQKKIAKCGNFKSMMNNNGFLRKYLSNFFSEVNIINKSMQGTSAHQIENADKIGAFKKKLELYIRCVDAGNVF